MSWKAWSQHKVVHVILVLLVFSCTGLTVARLGGLLSVWLEVERFSLGYWLLWIVALLPIYNVLLLCYAFIFGKYTYFREKQKRTWRKLTGWMHEKP